MNWNIWKHFHFKCVYFELGKDTEAAQERWRIMSGLDSISSMSGWDFMQSWSSKRQAAASEYQTEDAALSSALASDGSGSTGSDNSISALLSGGTAASSSSFMSNDALSSSLFGGVSDDLTNQEDLMASIIKARMAKEQAASASALDAQSSSDALAALGQDIGSMNSDPNAPPGSLVDISA